MSYSAFVRRLLISCPGDVPSEDLLVVHQTITRWNGMYGERFGAAVIPISWSIHAAAQFGLPAQQVLNEQIVDNCDVALAIFANRLGTPTAAAASGTAEEIVRLHTAGRYVGILRCRKPVDPSSLDLAQATRLETFLQEVKEHALILEYVDSTELAHHVDAILVAAVSHDQGRSEAQLQAADKTVATAEVWPRIESAEHIKTDQRGRVRGERHWSLMLYNTGGAPARDVSFSLSSPDDGDSDPWAVVNETRIPSIAPGAEIRFGILASGNAARQMTCTVTWDDVRGRRRSTVDLRLV